MIKRTDLLRHLLRHGCRRVREGRRRKLRSPVPRHREIPRTTVRAICRQLSIPPL